MVSFYKYSFVFLLFFNSFSDCGVFGDDVKDVGMDRGQRSEQTLWFGPRLGKRTLYGETDRPTYTRMLEAADAVKYYYDQYREAKEDETQESKKKKIIFTPKLGRSLEEDRSVEVDFTPRLGRRRELESMSVLPIQAILPTRDRKIFDTQEMRHPIYFIPRLEPRMTFSPRLGRSLVYDLNPESSLRVTRSLNKTATEK